MGRLRRPARFSETDGGIAGLRGLSGCGRTPEQFVVPYVKQPEGMVLGKPQFYATAMPFGADAIGLLVESHEGRPTKIEGNPDHPSSLGATNVFAQASVLNLYDPDRAQTVTKFGEIQTWAAFLDSAQAIAAETKGTNGAGFRILTGIVTFADASCTDSVATDAFSAGQVAPVGTRRRRRHARRREARLWQLRQHGLWPGKG